MVLGQVVLSGGVDVQVSVEALFGELRGRPAEPSALKTGLKTKKKTVKQAVSRKAAARASKSGGQDGWSGDDRQYNQLLLSRGADFMRSDRDGDGSTSLSKHWSAAGQISVSKSRADVKEVFHLVDDGKDGVLDITEYLNALSWLDDVS